MLIKKTYQQMNHFIVFKGAMKYQENIFSASQDIASTQKVQGAELKPVVSKSKFRLQQILV